MKKYIAFGSEVPQSVINDLLEDGISESEITIDFLETLLEYEYRDNN